MAELLEYLAPRGKPGRAMNLQTQPGALVRLKLVGILALLLGYFAFAPRTLGQSALADPATGMDQAIALLTEARLHFQNIRDYECRSVNWERVNGTMLPECVMTMKARNKPVSYTHLRAHETGRNL